MAPKQAALEAPPADEGFYVAVPSYRRERLIQVRTLALLDRQSVPRHRVYIFVADEAQREVYQKVLTGWPNIVTGVPTLWRQRNFIAAFFRAGTHVVSMDDDVEELFQCMPCKPDAACLDAKLMPLPAGALARIAADAKRRMKEWGAFLWSLNVSDNTFYMRQNIAHNNGLCNGFFWGCLIRHDEDLVLSCGDGHEDVERSARFFRKDGLVIRYRFLCAKTRCKANPGGLQALMKGTRSDEEEQGAKRLVAAFPHLLKLAPKKVLGLQFRRGLQSQLLHWNLLTPEHFKQLQLQNQMRLLEGAVWAALWRSGAAGSGARRGVPKVRRGRVERCTEEALCLREEGAQGLLGASCSEFYARLTAQEFHVVWLPGGASEALGTPAAWHHELGCLLQMESPEASEAPRAGLKRKAPAAEPRAPLARRTAPAAAAAQAPGPASSAPRAADAKAPREPKAPRGSFLKLLVDSSRRFFLRR